MDTYFEQLITMRKGAKELFGTLGVWVAALVLSVIFVFLSMIVPFISTLLPFIIAGLLFGAYKLSKQFSVEYEYIFTNGTFDVDKIIAQNSRKRMLSFEIPTVDVLEKYNPQNPPRGEFSKKVIACNMDDNDIYYIIVSDAVKGKRLLVFTPDERMKQGIKKFLPRYMQMSAFKD
ncbi:MAG: DUF6106 family protein [Oscillospiraceae bacterium]|nr:DUF6106 family protein [Oscillospiraceae bacterium]